MGLTTLEVVNLITVDGDAISIPCKAECALRGGFAEDTTERYAGQGCEAGSHILHDIINQNGGREQDYKCVNQPG